MLKKLLFPFTALLILTLLALPVYRLLNPGITIPEPKASITDPNTVAHTWQWENFQEKREETQDSASGQETESGGEAEQEITYDVVAIYNALQEVRLHENGEVVIDNQARVELESAYVTMDPNLDAEGLAEIQELIRIGLPGIAGKQTAEIVADYYHYRQVEEEVLQQSDTQSLSGSAQSYEQLVELRRAYLGGGLADKLYGEEEVQTRHTLAMMKLTQNTDLSDEEKSERQQALQAEMQAELDRIRGTDAPATDSPQDDAEWQQRYNAFARERDNILAAGLSQEDQQAQIDALQSRYFAEDELERVSASDFLREEKAREEEADDEEK